MRGWVLSLLALGPSVPWGQGVVPLRDVTMMIALMMEDSLIREKQTETVEAQTRMGFPYLPRFATARPEKVLSWEVKSIRVSIHLSAAHQLGAFPFFIAIIVDPSHMRVVWALLAPMRGNPM
jgi:hypothetical protein